MDRFCAALQAQAQPKLAQPGLIGAAGESAFVVYAAGAAGNPKGCAPARPPSAGTAVSMTGAGRKVGGPAMSIGIWPEIEQRR
jgi:hypothetical protein